jgi:monoterpene epsilon-lactone hydrolase
MVPWWSSTAARLPLLALRLLDALARAALPRAWRLLRGAASGDALLAALVALVVRRLLWWQSALERRAWFALGLQRELAAGALSAVWRRARRGRAAVQGWSVAREAVNGGSRRAGEYVFALAQLDQGVFTETRKVFELLSWTRQVGARMEADGFCAFDYEADGVACRAVVSKVACTRARRALGLKPSRSLAPPGLAELGEGEAEASAAVARPLLLNLHLHGGGYVSGTLDASTSAGWHFCRTAADRGDPFDLVTVLVDYRLAPEARFPAAVVDAAAAVRWHAALPGAPRFVLTGESAGGGLCAATLIALRDGFDAHLTPQQLAAHPRAPRGAAAKSSMPAAAVLMSPMLSCRHDAEFCAARGETDVISGLTARGSAKHYVPCPNTAASNALASPLVADLAGLPPLLVVAGECEIFFTSCDDFVRRAKRQGGAHAATLRAFAGQTHCFQLLWEPDAGGECQRAYDEAIAFAAAHALAAT